MGRCPQLGTLSCRLLISETQFRYACLTARPSDGGSLRRLLPGGSSHPLHLRYYGKAGADARKKTRRFVRFFSRRCPARSGPRFSKKRGPCCGAPPVCGMLGMEGGVSLSGRFSLFEEALNAEIDLCQPWMLYPVHLSEQKMPPSQKGVPRRGGGCATKPGFPYPPAAPRCLQGLKIFNPYTMLRPCHGPLLRFSPKLA